MKESSLVLLQTVPSHIDVNGIEKKLLSKFGNRILALHEFHIWRLTGNKIVATAHVVCRPGIDYMRLAEKLKEFFHDEGIHSTTLQLELTEARFSHFMENASLSYSLHFSSTISVANTVSYSVPDV